MNSGNNLKRFAKELLRSFLASLLVCIAGTATADDTDIFFGSAAMAGSAENIPNILLVLDTSGSMGNRDGGTESRMDRMKDAVKQMLMSNRDMNIGLMSYNNIYGGGPVLYPVTYLEKITCEGTDCAEPAPYQFNTYPVDGALGDIEQRASGVVEPNGSTLDFGSDAASGNHYVVGLRFAEINIARGATILEARLELVGKQSSSEEPARMLIEIQDATDPKVFTSANDQVTDPSYVSPSVEWIPDEWYEQTAYQSPDIKELVQDIVDRDTWCKHNPLAFKIETTIGSRDAYSHEGATNAGLEYMPKLIIVQDPSTAADEANCGVGSGPVTVTRRITKARNEMVDVVDDLFASGGTPTVDAFYEAALYLRGENVDYGTQRGIVHQWVPRSRLRVSHKDSYTGGTLVRETQCTDSNLNSSACNSERIDGTPTYISPLIGSCQASHIVLLSDGETNYNDSRPKILSMTGANACTDSGEEGCATELASWLLATDHSALADEQNITTHTIAYNLNGTGKQFLERVAVAGGGKAYEANTSDQLLEVLTDLVANVVNVDTSFTAPSATVNQFNRLAHRDDLYFAVFSPSENADWDGNVKRYRLGKSSSNDDNVLILDRTGAPAIDPDTGFFKEQSKSWWPEKTDSGAELSTPDGNIVARGGAANQISLNTGTDGVSNRNVYTWIGSAATSITSPIDLTADAQALNENNDLITSTILNIDGKESDATPQAAYRESLLKWARGVDVDDQDEDGSNADVRRTMGDPLHSRPVIVNYAPFSGSSEARSLFFVGTNEGYLHAIDTLNGQEQFAYVPYELLGNLDTFKENSPTLDRPYGLDGPITVWHNDTNNNQMVDANEKAMLYVGMRRGGNSYYALDISNPSTPKLAWTIDNGMAGFTSLGQSWSRMTPVKMLINGSSENVLVFGGGYDENQDFNRNAPVRLHTTDTSGAGIFIVRATTGELLWSGLRSSGGTQTFSDMEYGFNGHIRTIDINRDGYVDQMYAADAGGQLWRFDIAQHHAGSIGELADGGVIADFSNSLASGHRRFYNEPDVALIEQDGERFLSVSIGSGWRAHPLDEITDDRFYMVRQYAVYEKPEGGNYGRNDGGAGSSDPISESDLVNVTSTATPDTNQYGWFIELEKPGEKVLGASVTFDNKVIFTSYIPGEQAASCTPNIGAGRVYLLDVVSGAPAVNLDAESEVDSTTASLLSLEDRSKALTRGGIPPEAMIVITEDAPDGPKILIGGEELDTDISNATRRTFWSDEGESGEIVTTESEQEE